MSDELLRRRKKAMAPTYSLFYDNPVELIRGEGVWLYDTEGKRYLDCYNNVPSVGHCHPQVVGALSEQASLLNTHTRYLHPAAVELAERLGSMFGGDLTSCVFTCTGTEANDLAVQMARTVTGNEGVLVTESSYHGNSTLVGALSTDSYPAERRPDWLGVFEPPNTYRGEYRGSGPEVVPGYISSIEEQIKQLDERGHGTSVALLDTSWDSNGVLVAPDGYTGDAAAAVRAAGGLVIADEVQAGYCRMGQNFWGHENYDLVPDIVTLGKPMGAGHPIAAVVTTPAIAEAFAAGDGYFNTFGGNPVSARVALAVLDVIEQQELLANSATTGSYLGEGLRSLAGNHEVIGNVQGSGLFWGLDLVADRVTREPIAYADAKRLASDLSELGVLVGITGRFNNVLKIRPPLVFSKADADFLLEVLDVYLKTFTLQGGDDRRQPGAEW